MRKYDGLEKARCRLRLPSAWNRCVYLVTRRYLQWCGVSCWEVRYTRRREDLDKPRAATARGLRLGLSGNSDLVSGYCGMSMAPPRRYASGRVSETDSAKSHTQKNSHLLGAPQLALLTHPGSITVHTHTLAPALRCSGPRPQSPLTSVLRVCVVGVVVVPRLGNAESKQAPVSSPDIDKYHASPPLGFEKFWNTRLQPSQSI
jgi:hypothetical protein